MSELVFVGGCVTGLLITDEAAGEPRGTIDVDAIAEIKSYAQYAEFGDRLRRLGFHEDTSEGAPLCRWIQGGTILDAMPLDENILGFSNRWYQAAMDASGPKRLRDDIEIRIVTAPYFVATKLEAFNGRGAGDFLGSHGSLTGAKLLSLKCETQQPTLLSMCAARSQNFSQILASSTRFPGFFFRIRQASHESESSSGTASPCADLIAVLSQQPALRAEKVPIPWIFPSSPDFLNPQMSTLLLTR